MAKKAVATFQAKGKNVKLVKVYKCIKSSKTSAYTYAESIVPESEVKKVLS